MTDHPLPADPRRSPCARRHRTVPGQSRPGRQAHQAPDPARSTSTEGEQRMSDKTKIEWTEGEFHHG